MTKSSRHILNDEIRNDYARLLEIINDPRESDFTEIEALANKYRMYFDAHGSLVVELDEGREG